MPTADHATVTGLPPSIADVRAELTPMLSQYADLCADYEDALVLFQVGDFYEAFCEAAETVARVCEVTLTKREDSTGEYPMAGIPIDNAAAYLESLLDAGYRVAVADQVEDAEAASGLVDRAVTQVVTPGTVVEDELLSAGTTNYVAAVAREPEAAADGRDAYGLAAVDVATGECLVTGGDRATVAEEIDRVAPAELLRGPEVGRRTEETVDREERPFAPSDADAAWMESEIDDAFDYRAARDRLEPYVSAPERRFATEAELRAAGAVLAYAEYTQGDAGPLEYVARVRRYDPREHLRLDAAAQRSLELFENRGLGAGETLFDVLDETNCALGRRCLERWLRRPLVDADRIRSRHESVAALVEQSLAREDVADLLTAAYDLERLVGRVSRGRANARDLRSLHATLAVVPDLREALAADGSSGDSGASAVGSDADPLAELRSRLDPIADVRDLIDRAIAVDPPQEITDGGVIREGFDADLDDLRHTEREGREWIGDLERRERERTGIDSLKVGHNQVHGYYIEVTDANLDRVPDDYRRRQTLKNSERFYTPELKEREDEIVGAAERADALEYDLFTDVRETVAAESDRIQSLADALAELDALCSLATVAVERDYVRPEVVDAADLGGGGVTGPGEGDGSAPDDAAVGIEIEGGRHPVVERRGEFVPNDAELPRGSVAIVTGPNMSGKSTYMRQIALAVVLAQVGSFVPAQRARVPVVDRVFTRVGASDDIAGGQSTFMREMSELTEILHDATPNSLVLLDEVGRGTATTDGRAIARAAAEFIHDELGATTMFATHYHDLTDLAAERERAFNLHFTATRDDGEVTFLHRVARGASSSSYGVEVAELAGVPPAVVERSRDLLADGDAPDSSGAHAGSNARADPNAPVDPNDADATAPDVHASPETSEVAGGPDEDLDAVASTLRSLDLATTTPIDALNALYELQRHLE